MSEPKAINLELLKQPLPAEAVAPHPTKPYLSTIKAIYVVERFNEVFGLSGWYITNEVVEATGKFVVVKSNFYAPDFGIRVADIFGGNDNSDRGDAYKGACTDALTKIGSYLHVGMDVYKGLREDVAVPRVAPRVTKPVESAQPANPMSLLCHHGEPAKKVQSKSAKNPGRWFYTCPKIKAQQCDYFVWADEVQTKAKADAEVEYGYSEDENTYTE